MRAKTWGQDMGPHVGQYVGHEGGHVMSIRPVGLEVLLSIGPGLALAVPKPFPKPCPKPYPKSS